MIRVTVRVAAAVSILCAASLLAAAQVDTGAPAPDFTLAAADGSSHHLADLRGKWVVLEWINFDCPFVRKHYSSGAMQKLQEKYTSEGVIWYQINSSAPGKQGHFSGEELARRIAASHAKATAYLLDPDGRVGRAYGARTTPHMFIIDPEGRVVYQGAIDSIRSTDPADIARADNYVDQALSALLAGQPVPVAQTVPYGCSVKY